MTRGIRPLFAVESDNVKPSIWSELLFFLVKIIVFVAYGIMAAAVIIPLIWAISESSFTGWVLLVSYYAIVAAMYVAFKDWD